MGQLSPIFLVSGGQLDFIPWELFIYNVITVRGDPNLPDCASENSASLSATVDCYCRWIRA